jgi:hypothetical protein
MYVDTAKKEEKRPLSIFYIIVRMFGFCRVHVVSHQDRNGQQSIQTLIIHQTISVKFELLKNKYKC